ncbi:MAG: chromate transporter [Fervidobacterium sp.]
MIYLKLFFTFLQIGAISFGGGYSILKVITHYVVEEYKWITLDEFNSIVALSQSTPGPIGINAATFVGYKVGGMLGAIIATLSVILIPVTLSILLYKFYRKYSHVVIVQEIVVKLKPIILAMVASASLGFVKTAFSSFFSIIVTLISTFLLFFFKVDIVILILISGLIGMIFFD